jgi:hypothetical protein
MSGQILTQLPEHYQTQFADNWEHLVQQKESRLENKVTRYVVKGKERQFSQLGKSKMRLITTRNGVTIPSDTPMAKRWLRPKGYDEVTWIDQFDSIALGELPAPESEHVMSHAMAAKRTMDEVIIAALEGTAYIGVDGTTPVDVPASQKVAVDYVQSGSTANSGLTLAKMARAKYILDKNEVESEGRYFVHSAKQLNDLLVNVIEIKSSDYNNVKALVDGKVNMFLGFEFVMTELLTLDTATDIRTCIAYQKDGIALGIGMEKSVKIDILATQNHSVQIRTVLMIGATRKEEERVVLVYADESP